MSKTGNIGQIDLVQEEIVLVEKGIEEFVKSHNLYDPGRSGNFYFVYGLGIGYYLLVRLLTGQDKPYKVEPRGSCCFSKHAETGAKKLDKIIGRYVSLERLRITKEQQDAFMQ